MSPTAHKHRQMTLTGLQVAGVVLCTLFSGIGCSADTDASSNPAGVGDSSGGSTSFAGGAANNASGGAFGGPNAPGFPGAGGAGPAAGGSGGAGVPPPPPPPPPEEEVESTFQVPVATGRTVWTANPTSGLVALVDVHTLEVQVLQAGLEPTYLAAVPNGSGRGAALVINVGSDDATFFRVDDAGDVEQYTLALHTGANAWVVSESGRWAIAWTDASRVDAPDPTEAFQDVTVLDLQISPPGITRLNVGYRPRQIVFNEAESFAYSVNEPSITAIELGDAPQAIRDYNFEEAGAEVSRDVSITPDGALALIRVGESPKLSVLSLQDGAQVDLVLPAPVTDLDLAREGSLAIAVLRETAQLVLFDVTAVQSDPNDVEIIDLDNDQVGSVSVSLDGDQAFLFTNAVDSDRLSIFDLTSHEERSVALKAPVKAVFSAPTGDHAIALLDPGATSSRAGAFAVVPAAAQISPRIQGTDATPLSVALISQPVPRGLLTVSDAAEALYGVYVIRLPELQVDFQRLLSPPIATGIVADEGIGFVAQQHPEGRISFVDLEAGTVRTLTGFELGSQVVDGN